MKATRQVDASSTGHLNRRALLKSAAALGLSAPVSTLFGDRRTRAAPATQQGKLTVTYDQWIIDLHPAMQTVNDEYNNHLQTQGMSFHAEAAPTENFGSERFAAEANQRTSSWDAYIGARPFSDIVALIETGAIEPWNDYLPQGVADDFIPAIRDDGTYDEKLYVWPFLLDVVGQAWNMDQVQKAGLDPETSPQTWDDFIANGTKVKKSGVVPFGATFDIRAWRSLIPITHSISTEVYDPATGLFMWNSDASVQALEILRRVYEIANPDIVNPSDTATPTATAMSGGEHEFMAQKAAYCIGEQRTLLKLGGAWPDPKTLRLFSLPVAKAGIGGTVLWDTGAVLFRYGKNKQQAAEYLKALTYDQRIWDDSLAAETPGEPPSGQLPIYLSIWDGLKENPPDEVENNPWAFATRDQLDQSRAIEPTKLGGRQFDIALPYYTAYLTGEENNAKRALTKAMDAVSAAYKA